MGTKSTAGAYLQNVTFDLVTATAEQEVPQQGIEHQKQQAQAAQEQVSQQPHESSSTWIDPRLYHPPER